MEVKYFQGLSNFDKMVGGLVWCIETCDFDVDADVLLFHDDWSIGKNIALTEKVVSVLNRMNCPHKIEPHQIQGLDYIHIYPGSFSLRPLLKNPFRKHHLWWIALGF